MYQFLKTRTTLEVPEHSEHKSDATNLLNINDCRETRDCKFINSVNSRLSTSPSMHTGVLQSPEPSKRTIGESFHTSIVSLEAEQDELEEPPLMTRFVRARLDQVCFLKGDTWRGPETIRESCEDNTEYRWLQTEDRFSQKRATEEATSRKKIRLQNRNPSELSIENINRSKPSFKKNVPLRIETIFDRETALRRNKSFMKFVEEKAALNPIELSSVSQSPSHMEDSQCRSVKNSHQPLPNPPGNRRFILPF